MIKVYFVPPKNQFPPRGGVRTHLLKLYKHLETKVEFVDNLNDADLIHLESAWGVPETDKPILYISHGGFVPDPIPVVLENLKRANKIVSVAQWIVDVYFPEYQDKTIVIPNGVDLEDFKFEPRLILSNYILYAKEWNYYFEDFQKLVAACPDEKFVTTIWNGEVPDNVTYIGLQPKEKMNEFIKNAKCLLLTGSEVCPTMLLESWACKVPVLALAVDGSKEIMDNCLGGYLYQGFEDLLHGLAVINEEGKGLGEKGFEGVQAYLWENLVDEYLAVYERLLK